MKITKILFTLTGWLLVVPVVLAQPAQQNAPKATPQNAQASTAPKTPARVRTKLDGFELSPQSGKSANQVGGASRDLGTPRLFAPNSGKAYSTHPVFYWGTADSGEKVTFRLRSVNGQVIYETATTSDHLGYPADAPALTPGNNYTWTIVPENDMLGGAPQPVTVSIVGGSERDAIDEALKTSPGSADVFVQHRVWYDAVSSYANTLSHSPDDQHALAGRATLYDQLPVTHELADADWAMVH
jgi:hypothetical protein